MPPLPPWYRGKDEIRAFLVRGPLQSRWRFQPTTANGQLAFGAYVDGSPGGLFVLTLNGGKISALTRFHVDALYPRFGLPVHE